MTKQGFLLRLLRRATGKIGACQGYIAVIQYA
jgi:hypothetical protein